MPQDALGIVRSDLVQRIDAITASRGRISLPALCDQVDGIRRTARIHALDALEGLASLLETVIAYNGHGPVILSYLDLMRDAARSDSQSPDVSSRYAAALSVRLGA
jgi:hypothetical protein